MNVLSFIGRTSFRTSVFIFLFSLPFCSSYAQTPYDFLNQWQEYTDASNSLYQTLSNTAFHQLSQRAEEIARIKTLEDWKERQKEVKAKLQKAVGDFPERTPLHATVTNKIDKGEYRIENIVFESRPNFYVTASLFIPKERPEKAPAILYCSGHTEEGYRSAAYQQVILNLVKKGFIVFAYDPIGQGERLQYLNKEGKGSFIGGPTHEHSYPGAQIFMVGNTLANYMIWDGIRAVDYLFTRPEVDIDRIGITGRSGGGTQSAYIAAFDERILAAAPENYLTNFTRLLQTKGPQDAEQNFFHGIAEGLDHPDLLEVRAPRPALMITTTRDMFSIQGAMETEKEVSKVYAAYHSSENFKRVEDDSTHASTKKNRESLYAFFQKVLAYPGDSTDEKVEILTKELQVTPTGQVLTAYPQAETLFEQNKKAAQEKTLKEKDGKTISVDLLAHFIGYKKAELEEEPVFVGRYKEKGYQVENYFLKSTGGFPVPYLLLLPDNKNGNVLLFLDSEGKSHALGDLVSDLLRQGYSLLIPDLLLTGELNQGNYKGDSYINHASYGLWYLSMLTDGSIVGLQTTAISELIGVLKKRFDGNPIYGFAEGSLSIALLHALVLVNGLSGAVLANHLISYQDVVEREIYHSGFIYNAVPGMIGTYDLPDLILSLKEKKLSLLNPVNGGNKPLSSSELKSWKETWELNGQHTLHVGQKEIDSESLSSALKWIRE